MNMRSLVLALIAVVVAGGAAFGVRSLLIGNQTPQVVAAVAQQQPEKMVLVAVKSLPTGHIVALEDVKWAAWPVDGATTQYIQKGVESEQSLVGRVVKLAVSQGAPIVKTQVIGPGERGFLAAVLSPGMRAVTVGVSDTSGVGGFVFPGDRVDVLLTHEVPNGQSIPLRGSETILTNVRVLAVNEKTDDTTTEAGAIPGLRSVTLEVPPRFVEKLAVMQKLGALSLALRPIADESILAYNAQRGSAGIEGKDAQGAPLSKNPIEAATAQALAQNADFRAPLMVPSDKRRTFTVDREVSTLVTLARTQADSQAKSAAAQNPKPDITISRGDRSDDVTFTTKNAGPASPAAAPLGASPPVSPPITASPTSNNAVGATN